MMKRNDPMAVVRVPTHLKKLYATAKDGHEEARVCEAVLESHASRRWAVLH